eukprot:GHRQ01031116.1.p1 GENE.GHRQ01031116.1~~GHRQ01031116.1.p1  ORF type:complete len:228 (+),score=45.25 GHRQ01031116.1:115-798(+)
MADYSLTTPNAPPASGWTLRCMLAVAESPAGPAVINWVNRRTCPRLLHVLRQGSYSEEPRSLGIPPTWDSNAEESDAMLGGAGTNSSPSQVLRWDSKDEQLVPSQEVHARLEAALHSLGQSGTTQCSTAPNARPTVLDHHSVYKHGLVTPSQVAERVIAFLERYNTDLHILHAYDATDIRAQAAAATQRYAAGSSLSVFDGVPYVVKDSLDALPYETACGTAFIGKL